MQWKWHSTFSDRDVEKTDKAGEESIASPHIRFSFLIFHMIFFIHSPRKMCFFFDHFFLFSIFHHDSGLNNNLYVTDFKMYKIKMKRNDEFDEKIS